MNEREFDAFYSGSVGRLTGQLYAMTGGFAESQDVVQEGVRPCLGAADRAGWEWRA